MNFFSRWAVAVSSGLGLLMAVPVTPVEAQAVSGALISEFRFHGSGGSADEFVELYNTQNVPLDVSGWSIQTRTASGIQTATIPAGTSLIPARGHFLFTGSGYSAALALYGTSDASLGADAKDDSGVALFNAAGTLQDAAGFTSSDASLREGSGLISAPTANGQTTFMRRFQGQTPVDTGDNAADFLFLATDGASVAGTNGSITAQLGSPNPEGLTSPNNINAQVGVRVLDANFGPNVAPNRVRIGSGDGGSLVFRRIIKNNTGQPLSRIRLLITDITGQVSPVVAGQADVRVTTQADENVPVAGQGTVLVYGTTLEAPSTLPSGTGPTTVGGGGIGSSLNYDIVLTTPLQPNEERAYGFNVQVAKTGSFFVNINILALSVPTPITDLSATAGNNQVALSWTGVSGAASYKVFRSTTAGTYDFTTPLATGITTNAYTDTTVTNGTTYFYVVRATNGSGDGASSNQVSATPTAPPFEIVNVADGDTLSGRVIIQMNVYEVAAASEERWKLTVDGARVASAKQQPPLNGAARFNFVLETYLYSNGQHTIQVNDGIGRAATRNVSFSNAVSSISYTPVFDVTGSLAGRGIGDSCSISGAVESGLGWSVTIKNAQDQVVRTFTGVGDGTATSVNVVWNGRNNAGVPVPVDNYKLFMGAASSNDPPVLPIAEIAETLLAIINNVVNSDSLILIDCDFHESYADLLTYTLGFMSHIKAGNTPNMDVEAVSPLLVTERGVESSLFGPSIRALINYKFSTPLKFVYVQAHGRSYNVPQFKFGIYRWLSGYPGTFTSTGIEYDSSIHFDIRELIETGGIEYGGDSGDGLIETAPPKLVWIDTCASAGGIGAVEDLESGSNALRGERAIPGVNFGWDECFGISRGLDLGYQGVFVGFSGSTPLPSPIYPNWRQWRYGFWCFVFRDRINIGTTHHSDGSAAFLAPSSALFKAGVGPAFNSDGTNHQPQHLRRATGNPATAY